MRSNSTVPQAGIQLELQVLKSDWIRFEFQSNSSAQPRLQRMPCSAAGPLPELGAQLVAPAAARPVSYPCSVHLLLLQALFTLRRHYTLAGNLMSTSMDNHTCIIRHPVCQAPFTCLKHWVTQGLHHVVSSVCTKDWNSVSALHDLTVTAGTDYNYCTDHANEQR